MASTIEIVNDLLSEAGMEGDEARDKLALKVGEVVVDLLSQGSSRFRGLEKTQTINILTTTKQYKLNADFASASKSFHEVDSDGEPIGECNTKTKKEVNARKLGTGYSGYRLCYTRKIGSSFYLVLATEPDEDTIFEFDYFRKPTKNDTDIIRSVKFIKDGVRASFPEWFSDQNYSAIYIKEKSGFMEDPDIFQRKRLIRPQKKVERHNRNMSNIGRGY